MIRHPSVGKLVPILVACAIVATPLLAENVLIRPVLREGDVMQIEMKTARERKQAGRPVNTGATTQVTLEVLDVGESEVVIGWTDGKTEIEGEQSGPFPSLDPLMKAAEGSTRELVFDAEFNYLRLRNLDEVTEQLNEMFSILEAELGNDPVMRQVMTQTRGMLAKPETVNVLLADKPGRYFLPFGWELAPGEPRTSPVELPNPFGGDPLPATLTVTLEPPDAGEPYVMTWVQQIDPEAATAFVKQAIVRMGGGEEVLERELPKMNVSDEARFEIDRESGWVVHGKTVRTVEAMGGFQRDTIEFKLKPGSKPAAK